MKKQALLFLITLEFLLAPALSQAVPVSLKKFPPSPRYSFDPDELPQIPRCVDLMDRFDRLSHIIDENNGATGQFMSDSSLVIEEWHSQLQPLEGQPVTLPLKTFDPLEEGAAQINEVINLSYENADYISKEMAKISQALAKCIPQQGGSLGRSINN